MENTLESGGNSRHSYLIRLERENGNAPLHFTNDFNLTYAIVFIVEALGLYFSIWLLLRVGVASFAKEHRPVSPSGSELIAATIE